MGALVLEARSNLNGFSGNDSERYWSTGVLEYWSVGKCESLNFNLSCSSITPALHHSITPGDSRVSERPTQG